LLKLFSSIEGMVYLFSISFFVVTQHKYNYNFKHKKIINVEQLIILSSNQSQPPDASLQLPVASCQPPIASRQMLVASSQPPVASSQQPTAISSSSHP
jgi:hypothetical protein